MIDILIYIFLIFIFALLIFIKYKEKGSGINERLPYKKKEYLMTVAEKDFFETLKQVVGNRYYIIPQVKISNLAYVSGTKSYKTYLNKIDRKTIDFVLFDNRFSPVIAVELDDNSHNSDARKERDNFVDEIMNTIGLKIVHIKNSSVYNKESIEKLILNP